jgi:hypothetical protein
MYDNASDAAGVDAAPFMTPACFERPLDEWAGVSLPSTGSVMIVGGTTRTRASG